MTLFKTILYKKIQNPHVVVLLILLNTALIMNFNFVVWQNLFSILSLSISIIMLIYKRFFIGYLLHFLLFSYYLLPHFPRMANHCNIELVVLGCFFIMALFYILKNKPLLSNQSITLLCRTTLVWVYFYAGFHKLNSGFFSTCYSCANFVHVQFLKNITGHDYILDPNVLLLLQVATIIIEMIVPFGLFHQSTRKITVCILLFFHGYLSLIYYADFSALAVFLLFGSVANFEDKKTEYQKTSLYVIISILAILIRSMLLHANTTLANQCFIFGIIYNIGLTTWVFYNFVHFKKLKNTFTKKHYTIAFIPFVIISLWTLKTYIGLGNCANLTMFSNLITLKNESNHFLIDTKNTKLFQYEEDYILILSIKGLKYKTGLEHQRLPIIEFKYLSSKWIKQNHEKISVLYQYQNKTYLISDLKKHEYSKSDWWYQFVFFRKIQPINKNKCIW